MSTAFEKMVTGRVLARNTGWNLLGLAAPMLAALAAIPFLISSMGTERFGFLTVAWVIIGYFGFFDLGISRALTKLLADRIGSGRDEDIPGLIWTALILMAGLGLVGAALLAALAPWLVREALEVPVQLHGEGIAAFYVLAASLPAVITTAGLRGVLEANQKFGLVNALRVPMGLFTYLGPLAVLPFTTNLLFIVSALVAGRVLATLAHLIVCLRVFPLLRGSAAVRRDLMKPLLRIGGWMTVSNVVSPLMTYADRFLIGAFISMTAVAYYATPYEVITKFWLVPAALIGVLFPAFATSYAHDRNRTTKLYERGVRVIFLIMFPIALVVIALAREGLTVWLGPEFAANSTRVLQWLAAGVFINSLGQVPYSVLQGIGRPDITGKLHLAELPFYLLAIWWAASSYGIEGIAVVWVIRVTLDTAFLFLATRWFLPGVVPELRGTMRLIAVAPLILAVAAVQAGLLVKLTCLAAFLAIFGLVTWFRFLDPGERALVRG
ncbi:MAG: flippase [Gemmatimonadota bacterium]